MNNLVRTDEAKFLPYRRVLVTGGTGFVGRHLVPRLAARLPPNGMLSLAGRNTDRPSSAADYGFVEFDLNDPATIFNAIGLFRPDLIVHLAGEASVNAAEAKVVSTWRLNVVGALEMATAIAAHVPETTMLYVSSAEVYGRSFLTGIVSEDSIPVPTSVYAQSKLAAEQILSQALPKTSSLIIARPSNHIGPGQDQRFVMPAFAAQIAEMEVEGAATLRVGNLESQRDFMDVRDTVDAYLALLATSTSDNRRIFNVSSGTARSVKQLLELLRGLAKVKTDVEVDDRRFRSSEIPLAEVDSSRLRAATGWSPRIPIEGTIVDVLNDWRARIVG